MPSQGSGMLFSLKKAGVRRQNVGTQKQQKQRKPPSFRAQRSGVEKSFYAEALRREKKSHTDYTDFHGFFSPTTDYARKRADCTEPDEEKTKTIASHYLWDISL